MAYLDKAKQAEASRRHYEKNKAQIVANVHARNARVKVELRKQLTALKESTPCTDCGNQYPAVVMEFDHVVPGKRANVSDLVGQAVSWKRILAEISLCELVCANCHRMRHMQDNQDLV